MTLADLFVVSDGLGGTLPLLDGVSSNVTTLLVAFVGVNLLFVGYRYIRKGGIR